MYIIIYNSIVNIYIMTITIKRGIWQTGRVYGKLLREEREGGHGVIISKYLIKILKNKSDAMALLQETPNSTS